MGYGCAAGRVSYASTEDDRVLVRGNGGGRCVGRDTGIGKSVGIGVRVSCGVVSCPCERRLSEWDITVQNPGGKEKS